MSSILNVLRSAQTSTRHFTSLQIVAQSKASFNPEHHPIVLQQLVESLGPNSTTHLTSTPHPSSHGTHESPSSHAYSTQSVAPVPAEVHTPVEPLHHELINLNEQ